MAISNKRLKSLRQNLNHLKTKVTFNLYLEVSKYLRRRDHDPDTLKLYRAIYGSVINLKDIADDLIRAHEEEKARKDPHSIHSYNLD